MSATGDLRPLDRSLPIGLLRAREAVMGHFRPILGRHGVTDQQWRVLRALDAADRPLSVGELADHACLLGPSVSRMLRGMEDRGWIARGQDDTDARRAVITLGADGRALMAAIGPASERAYRHIESVLGPSELDSLLARLDELTAALDHVDTGDTEEVA